MSRDFPATPPRRSRATLPGHWVCRALTGLRRALSGLLCRALTGLQVRAEPSLGCSCSALSGMHRRSALAGLRRHRALTGLWTACGRRGKAPAPGHRGFVPRGQYPGRQNSNPRHSRPWQAPWPVHAEPSPGCAEPSPGCFHRALTGMWMKQSPRRAAVAEPLAGMRLIAQSPRRAASTNPSPGCG